MLSLGTEGPGDLRATACSLQVIISYKDPGYFFIPSIRTFYHHMCAVFLVYVLYSSWKMHGRLAPWTIAPWTITLTPWTIAITPQEVAEVRKVTRLMSLS